MLLVYTNRYHLSILFYFFIFTFVFPTNQGKKGVGSFCRHPSKLILSFDSPNYRLFPRHTLSRNDWYHSTYDQSRQHFCNNGYKRYSKRCSHIIYRLENQICDSRSSSTIKIFSILSPSMPIILTHYTSDTGQKPKNHNVVILFQRKENSDSYKSLFSLMGNISIL